MDFFDYYYIEIIVFGAGLLALGVVVGAVIFALRFLRARKGLSGSDSRTRDLDIFSSREDSLSQLFFLLSLLFSGVTLSVFNDRTGNYFSWQWIILIISIGGLIISYRFKAILILPLSLLGGIFWWTMKATDWVDHYDLKEIALFIFPLVLALVFYVTGKIHKIEERHKKSAAVYSVFSVIFVTAGLFLASTEFGLEIFQQATEGNFFLASWQFILTFAFVFLALIIGLIAGWLKKTLVFWEIAAILGYATIFALILFLSDVKGQEGEFGLDINMFWAGFFNIFLLGHLILMLLAGHFRREEWLINLASFSLFAFIFIKYFDWFFDFIDKSIFFISAGILLLVLGWLMEKGRRYMISASKHTT
ncbi:hypothetical protein C4572_00750 [Candidatus Parcubacteria bacterium]|nr:MAG: hypothetical protein C4572_00750 [Candidatus Parcubacteria bacterium]